MKEVYHEYRILSKQHDRLKKKIAAAAEQVGIVVDEEIHVDLMAITSEGTKFFEEQPCTQFIPVHILAAATAGSSSEGCTNHALAPTNDSLVLTPPSQVSSLMYM